MTKEELRNELRHRRALYLLEQRFEKEQEPAPFKPNEDWTVSLTLTLDLIAAQRLKDCADDAGLSVQEFLQQALFSRLEEGWLGKGYFGDR